MAVKKIAKNPEASRLSRDDWLDAAFDAVAEGGFDKVRVLVLAEKLGVTRGSFYWHFTDHADLIAALLSRWREREAVINNSIPGDELSDPHAVLEALLDAALAHAGSELKNIRFELALRGLARRDPAVEKILINVDDLRMELFEKKFRRLTDDAEKATELAVLFYLAITGSHQALSRPSSTPRMKDYLRRIIATHLIHRV